MHPSIHLSIVILLCAAVLIVTICRVLRLSPVIGYLAAGAAIGPFGLGLINDVDGTTGIAEFGVIFLLFIIGLELSFERLRSMRKHVFEFGGAQLLLTSSMFAALIIGMGGNTVEAIIIGGGLALSSTAIVLQVIAEQGEKSSQVGRLSLAALILQDMAVIPLLILVSLLGTQNQSLTTILTDAAFKASVGLVGIFGAGYLLLRPLFRFIASLDNTELFAATTLLVVFGVSQLTSAAGLSPALGAFIAGLLIAETEFKLQVEADVLPFKGLFLGLFFMTVGMSLNLPTLYTHFAAIIGITVTLMVLKSLIIIVLCRVFGFSMSTAIHSGLMLSQGGEFSFILFSLAASQHALPAELEQILLVVVTISMALTPLVAMLGKKIALAIEKHSLSRPETILEETLDLSHHVIIAGYGRVGHTVAQLLEAERIHYVAIDMDSVQVSKERKRGTPVYYGDTTRVHVLGALGISRARAVIVTHSDTRVALQTIMTIRELNRDIPIIARAKNIEKVQKLEAAGANLAIAEMYEVSLQLGGSLLKALGVTDHKISKIIDLFRAEDYAATRAAESDTGVEAHASLPGSN
jgi:CPA2 family monovalent cation:H+ antiporter-2